MAILVLDTPIPGVAEDFGDFGDNVSALLKAGIFHTVKYQIAFLPCDDLSQENAVEEIFLNLSALVVSGVVRGVVLTGSRESAYATDNVWLNHLDKFIQSTLLVLNDFPIVGLCFGHQVIAKNLGCKVNRNAAEYGWEVGTLTISLNKSIMDIAESPFKDVLVTEDKKFLEHINLVEFHRDIVYGLPTSSSKSLVSSTEFQNLGSTSKCSIQGLVTDSGPIKVLTFQGHPEFGTEEALKMLEINAKNNVIDKAVFERLTYNTRNLVNQGDIIGKVICVFIERYF